MAPGPLGPHTFSTYNKCYWGKNYTCITNLHDIYFIKYINYFRKMLLGSEYARVLNISESWICLWFWIWQGSEQTSVLNKRGFWIYQGSEYASGSEFARVLNMSGLHRVLNMPEYAWLWLTEYAWIYLNMPQYARIYLNLPGRLLFYISPL